MTLTRGHWFYLYTVLSFGSVFLWLSFFPTGLGAGCRHTIIGLIWITTLILAMWLCHRPATLRRGVGRSITLGGSGLWVAHETLPGFDAGEMAQAGWLRWFGIAVAAMFEGAALLAFLRMIFGRESDPAMLRDLGVPPVLIKAMMAEARFWRWVWNRLTGH
ncbi:hypothetical protein [Asaia krungthepensis]|uniref:Uncharacterized protein n=1 Tax=Asaia krungthepensis NRIC 0535 TaxID=1307925 RepID=A0ABQ0Q2A8_9PROT|nr:hypothetical protein [Asaia krungthepensis]GBQ87967.1 hypothetical protein AA0535_1415 [Asaia krungthepensis NRIC 0535]